jgi:hypothetical protein
MATFTMYLHEVIESLYGDTIDTDDFEIAFESITFENVTYGKLPVLPQYDYIGLAYYPIFNENYRKILNGKIIEEYWNSEIGQETIEVFVATLRKAMNQIMPFYNELYASKMLTFEEALKTMDIHSVGTNIVTGEETLNSTNTSESETKSGSRSTNLVFPQTALAGNADYATSAVDSTSTNNADATGSQENESTTASESNSDNRVTGFQGNLNNLVAAFRANIVNIDEMLLADPKMKECFMLLANNGDEYTTSEYRYGWI